MKNRVENLLFGIGVFDQFLVAAVLAWTWPLDPYSGGLSLLTALLLVTFWAQLHKYFGLYESHRLEGLRGVATRMFSASTLGFIVTSLWLLIAGLSSQMSALGKFALIWGVLVLLSRAVLYATLRSVRRRGVDRRHVCVIGPWESAVKVAERFHGRPEWGLQISTVGTGSPNDRTFFRFSDRERIGKDLEEVHCSEVIDEILIICRPEDVPAESSAAIEFCQKYGLQCRIQLLGGQLESTPVEFVRGHATWTVHNPELNTVALYVKRCLDVVLSGLSLLLLSPLFLLLAVLVKLSSPGPVFFRQTRVGLRGRRFTLIKYRTMVAGAESMLHLVAHRNITGGPVFKDAKDLRITHIGRILRRFSLDELPQLLNVLKGDMSLVGPRPLPVHESTAIEGTFRRRFNMKPGITCRWQVQGRNEIGFTRWMELDVEYVDNWSLREDVKLLVLTIPAVFSGRGAY